MEISETRNKTISEVSKSQTIRLADIFIIGPTMIGVGHLYEPEEKFAKFLKYSLIVYGWATVIYNSKNYLENKKG